MRLQPPGSNDGMSRRMQVAVVAGFSLLGVVLVIAYLYNSSDPAAARFLQLSSAPFRVFGPAPPEYEDDVASSYFFAPGSSTTENSDEVYIKLYTYSEQRAFLAQYGAFCEKAIDASASAGVGKKKSSSQHGAPNWLLQRFDELPRPYGTELWKYCVLYTGIFNVYWESHNLQPFMLWEDLLKQADEANLAIKMKPTQDNIVTTGQTRPALHNSLLRIVHPFSKVCLGMMRYMVETQHLAATELAERLALYVEHDQEKKRQQWILFTARCLDLIPGQDPTENHQLVLPGRSETRLAKNCPLYGGPGGTHGGHCCQVWREGEAWPAMALRNTYLAEARLPEPPVPVSFEHNPEDMTYTNLGMAVEDVPYVATIRVVPTGAPPASEFETPNYFDILTHNNCLPHDKECFKCLKTGYNEGDEGGDCNVCQKFCPCYCRALCQVRPPPKRLAAHWYVQRPFYKKDPSRLIPKVVHQTWFEPVTKDKYPNMSRLIESFRQAGYEYEFYDDDRAAEFLSAHFPPEVRDAYDAIIPGAFKADLFRYCVLLIRGGLYCDMDILNEGSTLDKVIENNVGFYTPQDSPGMTIGHRHCLWNGLMGSAPGHPFLAQTIQVVVNNVQNRYTSVDYDDMLCPDPVLSVSHTVDTLFVCGPCILGAGLNDVLKLHRQTGFEYGDIDIFQAEVDAENVRIDADDPRLLIEGRSLILRQDKQDMGAHRFSYDSNNVVVAATDMPEYDDRPKSLEHYSKTHEKFGIYGLHKLYTNSKRTNEEFVISVLP